MPLAPPPPRDAEPAGDAEALAPAEAARRAVARIIDTLIVGVPVSSAGQLLVPHTPGSVAGVVLVAFALVSFGYELPQLAVWGQTLGKRFAGIRVVDAEGYGRVPVRRLLIRAGVYNGPLALRPVPVLGLLAGLFWLANGLWLFGDPRTRSRRGSAITERDSESVVQGQALHDRAAGTAVVRTR